MNSTLRNGQVVFTSTCETGAREPLTHKAKEAKRNDRKRIKLLCFEQSPPSTLTSLRPLQQIPLHPRDFDSKFPSATSTCLRADLKNSNIGSVNKSQAPSKKKPDGGLYKRSCLFTTQSNTTASPFPNLRVHSKHEGTNMKCKPNCASGGTLSKTRLASCSSGILAGSTGEYWRAAPARYWPDTLQDPPARVGSTGELRWDTQRDTRRDPLAGGMLGGIHWRAALAGYSAGSTGGIVWRDTGSLPDSFGGILDGIHWRNCLAGCGSTAGLLWRDTGRDPLAELFGGILGGIHWRTPLAGCWAGSTGGIVWRDTGWATGGLWAGSTGGPLWRDTGRDPLADHSGGILGGMHWGGGPLWRDAGRDSLADSSGGILGGIHWRTPLAGYWAESSLAGGCGVAASQTWILLEI